MQVVVGPAVAQGLFLSRAGPRVAHENRQGYPLMDALEGIYHDVQVDAVRGSSHCAF